MFNFYKWIRKCSSLYDRGIVLFASCLEAKIVKDGESKVLKDIEMWLRIWRNRGNLPTGILVKELILLCGSGEKGFIYVKTFSNFVWSDSVSYFQGEMSVSWDLNTRVSQHVLFLLLPRSESPRSKPRWPGTRSQSLGTAPAPSFRRALAGKKSERANFCSGKLLKE